MTKLQRFYELISRNAHVTLTNRHLDKTYYEGSVRSIPEEYDECEVEDFCMNDEGSILLRVFLDF